MTIKPYQARLGELASKCAVVKRGNRILTRDESLARIADAIKRAAIKSNR